MSDRVVSSNGSVEQGPLPLPLAARALVRCAVRTASLVAHGALRQPAGNVGRRIRFADGSTGEVYRETVAAGGLPRRPAVLVVSFRLRHVRSEWAHALFRAESELNTMLFAGFPGFVSKLWMRHDERGVYRGFYQWDGPEQAAEYVRALWWVLALVSERESIRYSVLPGLDRDVVLADPRLVDELAAAPGAWWCPAGEDAAAARRWGTSGPRVLLH